MEASLHWGTTGFPAELQAVQREGELPQGGLNQRWKISSLNHSFSIWIKERWIGWLVAAAGTSLGDTLAPWMGRALIMCILVMG